MMLAAFCDSRRNLIYLNVNDLLLNKLKKSINRMEVQTTSTKADKATMASDEFPPHSPSPLSTVFQEGVSKTVPRSRSPQRLSPWVPPPAKSTRGSKCVQRASLTSS